MGEEKTREAIRDATEAWKANEAPRKTLPWWALLLISIGGAVVPQLCNLIPNAVGSTLCQVVAKAALAVAQSDTGSVVIPTDPALKPSVVNCPADRLLSTGQCLPAAPQQ